MRARSPLTLLVVLLALLGSACSIGQTSDSADAPAITVARFETTLRSAAPAELAASDGGDNDDQTSDAPTTTVVEEPTTTVAEEQEETDPGVTSPPPTQEAPAVSSFEVEWVEFELDDVFDEEHIIGAWVPVGWEAEDFFGKTFSPADGSPFGIFTELSFDNGCDGLCEAKDWAAALNGPDGWLTGKRSNGAVLVDQDLGDGWLMVTEGDLVQQITFVRWDNAESFYFSCSAETEDSDQQLVDDFVTLCQAARPQWLAS